MKGRLVFVRKWYVFGCRSYTVASRLIYPNGDLPWLKEFNLFLVSHTAILQQYSVICPQREHQSLLAGQ